jgi:hypothetical protein
VVRVCLLGILAGVIWWNWDYFQAQAQARWKIYQMYRAQQAWLNSAPPPGELVYADEPVGEEPPPDPLAVLDVDFVWTQVLTPRYLNNRSSFLRATFLYESIAFAKFLSVSGTTEFDILRQSVPHRGLAFSGERITPAGVHCVVAVEVEAAGLVITGWTRSTMTQPGKLFIHPQTLIVDRGLWSHQFRVFAGKADDADPSRFTLQCQVGERRAVITARLLDTHRVEFSVPGWLDEYDEMVDGAGLPVVMHFWRALGRDSRPVAWRGTPRRLPLGDGKDVLDMRFVSNSEIAIAYPGRIDVRRLTDGEISRTSTPQEPLVHSSGHESDQVGFSPDGSVLHQWCDPARTLSGYDTRTGRMLWKRQLPNAFPIGNYRAKGTAGGQDQLLFMSTGSDRLSIYYVDPRTGAEPEVLLGPVSRDDPRAITSGDKVLFDAQRSTLYAANQGALLRYQIGKGRLPDIPAPMIDGSFCSLALAADTGDVFVLSNALLRFAGGQTLDRIIHFDATRGSVPDNARISATRDGKYVLCGVYVINPETREVATPPDRGAAAQFFPDERHIIRIDRNDLIVYDLSTIQAFDAPPK